MCVFIIGVSFYIVELDIIGFLRQPIYNFRRAYCLKKSFYESVPNFFEVKLASMSGVGGEEV